MVFNVARNSRSFQWPAVGLMIAVAIASDWFVLPVAAQEPAENEKLVARGVVYHDANANRYRDADEVGVPDVGVSNGREIVETDAEGRYEIEIDARDSVVFLIKPHGWRTPFSDDRLPLFFYIHKPEGSPSLNFPGVPPTGDLPQAINFPLYPQEEPDQFEVLLFGDTQARNETEEMYIANDVVAELIGSSAAFGVTLGDIVFDQLAMFRLHNQTIATIGIPWYNVIGNHDVNWDAKIREHANETFESVYGPSYYSYDFGQVHFVVLDNIDWVPASATESAHYTTRFGPTQIEFLRNDLARIPADQMVVLLMHVPLIAAADRHELYRLIEQRPLSLSISGHTHTHEHHFIGSTDDWRGATPHHHIVNVTVCGSWWSGQKDERGVPHATMTDGSPNGYSILRFDGSRYELDFRAAGREPDYQMEIGITGPTIAGQLEKTSVWVNVFNGSERSIVQMQLDTDESWIDMIRELTPLDPNYVATFEREAAIVPEIKPKMSNPSVSKHHWRARLPADLAPGLHVITVKTTDMFGREYAARRIVNVKPPTEESAGGSK